MGMNAIRQTTDCPQCHTPFRGLLTQYERESPFDGLAQCDECGLVTLVPMQTPDEVEAIYANIGNWELLSASEVALPNQRRRKMLERLNGDNERSVYDIGASHGAFLAEMQRHDWRIGGLEPAPADARVTESRLGITLDTGFFGPQTQPSAQWDVVTCWDVLEHMPDPADCLGAMIRHAKPGGLVSFAVPHIEGLPAQKLGARWRYLVPPLHIHFFPIAWLHEQANRHNADIIDITGFAKVHALLEAAVPRSLKETVIRAMPNRLQATDPDPSATVKRETMLKRGKRLARKALRRAVLQVNQTPVPLRFADLIDVTLRVRS
jgi:SAM-dependent methyltransferase